MKKITDWLKVILKKKTLKKIILIIQIIVFPIIVIQLFLTQSQISLMKDQINDFRNQEIGYKISSIKLIVDDIKYNNQKMTEMIKVNPFLNKKINLELPNNFVEFDKSQTDQSWKDLPEAGLSFHKLNDKAYTSGRLFDNDLGTFYDTIAVYYNNMSIMNNVIDMAWNLLYKDRNLPVEKKSLLIKKIMYHASYELKPYLITYSKLSNTMIIKLNALTDKLHERKDSFNN